jgi:hypothetical protein
MIERQTEPDELIPVAPELQGAKGDMLAARVLIPIIIVVIYGVYKFIRLGYSPEHFLYTYIPVFGGLAAAIGLLSYYFVVAIPRRRSWKNLVLLLGFLPYLFSLYVIGFLGVFMIYNSAVVEFSMWSILVGFAWIIIGYRIIYQFYLMTNIPTPPLPRAKS